MIERELTKKELKRREEYNRQKPAREYALLCSYARLNYSRFNHRY